MIALHQSLLRTALAISTLAMSGCVTMTTATNDTAFDSRSRDGLVLFGVAPNYRVAAKKGTYSDSEFMNSDWRVFEFNVFPSSGYVVSTVSPTSSDETYALLQILPEGIGGQSFQACDGLKAATFQALPGQVTYIGEFEYRVANGQLRILHTVDLEKANAYLKANYKGIRQEAVYVPPTWLSVKGLPCARKSTIYVPVYIPRSK